MKNFSKKKKFNTKNTFRLSVLGFLLLTFALGTMALLNGGFDLRQQAQFESYCIEKNQCVTTTGPCCSGLVSVIDSYCGEGHTRCVAPAPTATPPTCSGNNQCASSDSFCCTGMVMKIDTSCPPANLRCITANPSPTPACIGSNQCVSNGGRCCSGLTMITDRLCGSSLRCVTSVLKVTPVASGTCISPPSGITTCQTAGYYPASTCTGVCSVGSLCCGAKIPNQICKPGVVTCGTYLPDGGLATAMCNDTGTGYTLNPCPNTYICSTSTNLCVPPPVPRQ